MHHLSYNQFSSPTFDAKLQYVFQKALISKTDPVFLSVKHVSFTLTKLISSECQTIVPFIVCARSWKNLCFNTFTLKTLHG